MARREDAVISIILPVYNEGAHIKSSVGLVENLLKEHRINYEFVLVDDGSKDNSWAQLSELAKENNHVISVRFSRNFGKEAALCAGLDHATGDAVIVMDADLQHPMELIPEMVRLWREEEYDVVEGVKSSRGKEGFLYKCCAKGFYSVLLKMTGIDLRNASDYKLLDRKVVEAMQTMPEKVTFFRGMSAWVGFERVQVPFEVKERVMGTSKWSLKRLAGLAFSAITSYTSAPLQLVTVLGVVMFFISVILGAQTLVRYLMGNALEGFTTVILLLLFIGSMLMISLGIIGMYLMKIYHEIKGRPRYLISRKIKDGEEEC